MIIERFQCCNPAMISRFRHVALIGKYQPTGARAHDEVLEGIAAFLESQGCQVAVERSEGEGAGTSRHPALSVEEIGQRCDLGLVVGGDGTMLGIGRLLAPYGVPLIGINRGRLGFVTDIPLDNYQATLTPMLAGEYEEDHRSLLQAQVLRDGQSVFEALAMNDVVVNRGATSGMVELRVSVGNHLVANQRADGLIIASPTGSTAYALSAGGPLLHPAIPGWVMVPIAPHTLSNRPILLPDGDEISIELVAGRDASANFDMQSLATLMHGDRIVVRRSAFGVRFLHPKGWSYFDTLRKKLHWNEGGS
jgi:NAD+ kinase